MHVLFTGYVGIHRRYHEKRQYKTEEDAANHDDRERPKQVVVDQRQMSLIGE